MKLKAIVLIGVVLLGLITPFIDSFAVIQFFVLLIPFGIYFMVTLIATIYTWIRKSPNRTMALYLFVVLPVFLLSQLGSTFVLNSVQKQRAGNIIDRIETERTTVGSYPIEVQPAFGIHYTKEQTNDHFKLTYKRGFMVREEYSSATRSWTSRGWND